MKDISLGQRLPKKKRTTREGHIFGTCTFYTIYDSQNLQLNISQYGQLTLILLVVMDALNLCQMFLELRLPENVLLPIKSLNIVFTPPLLSQPYL